MIYGYARISRKEQNIDRQLRNIKAAYADAVIYTEAFTGTKLEGRTQLERLLKTVKAGDTIVFDSVSRMSRNAAEGVELYQRLFAEGVELVFIKEPHISTQTYKDALARTIKIQSEDEIVEMTVEFLNRLLMKLAEKQIKQAFDQAQKEVDDLHQRTREGIETARQAGKQIGGVQGKKLTTKKSVQAKAIIRAHSKTFGGTLKDDECMRLCGISQNSYYKYKREIASELETA